jgi:hypothetical protein
VIASSRSISSIVDAISDVADDMTIASRTLGQPGRRAAAEAPSAEPSAVPTTGAEPRREGEPPSDRPQLAYMSDPGTRHLRYIDVETSLQKLGLTREQLMSRTWPRGSPQHRLKRAAANKPRGDNGAAPH